MVKGRSERKSSAFSFRFYVGFRESWQELGNAAGVKVFLQTERQAHHWDEALNYFAIFLPVAASQMVLSTAPAAGSALSKPKFLSSVTFAL